MLNKAYPPLRFTGIKQKETVEVIRNNNKEPLSPYIPDDNLIKAVNLALLLEKPLLVLGEPGSGKSLLARAVAFDIYELKMYEHYFEWFVKSTSKAKEGLYEFDQIHRLRDATLPDTVTTADTATKNDVTDVNKYIHLGPMGEAFEKSVSNDKRSILLIDEVDKADIDFPNDLLNELDKMEFIIPELRIEEEAKKKAGKSVAQKSLVKAAFRPIVIITSNSEKDLPDAFLRRCIFHYIEPLSKEKLKEIILGRYYETKKQPSAAEIKFIDNTLRIFSDLRETIKTELLALGKNVSTSEFLDWFEVIKYFKGLKKKAGDSPELTLLLDELGKLDAGDVKKIPYSHILLKNINSVLRFNEQGTA